MNQSLEGIKIVDLSNFLPGPFCSVTLADLGAQVVKIEPPTGDPMRAYDQGVFDAVNHNKSTVSIDLKTPEGVARVHELVAECDVFIEGFRPGVADRLGVGYDALTQINPALIYCSISGYGQFGDRAQQPGHDINYLAHSGVLSLRGQLDDQPKRAGIPVGDLAAAMYSTVAILAALRERDRTGEGSRLDVAIRDSLLSWIVTRVGTDWKRDPNDIHRHLEVTNDLYVGSDRVQFAIGAIEEKFWDRLRLMVLPFEPSIADSAYDSSASRKANAPALRRILVDFFATRPTAHWIAELKAAEVPSSEILDPSDIADDASLRDRGIVTQSGDQHFTRFPVLRNGAPWHSPLAQVSPLDTGEPKAVTD